MTTIDEKNLELECLGDMTLTMVNVFRCFAGCGLSVRLLPYYHH